MPFTGDIKYWVEDSYGSGESTTTLPVSCKVQDARIGSGDRKKDIRDFSTPLICHFLEQTHDPTFHLEYIPQCGDTLIDDVIDRTGSCCSLQSLAFCVGANTCKLLEDDRVYFYLRGCKPSTVRLTSSTNNEWSVIIDFNVKSVLTYKTAIGTQPSPLTGNYCQFNVAGLIHKTYGHVVNTDHIAFITNAIDITISHQITSYFDSQATYKSYAVEGTMGITGTVDITLDGGGGWHFAEVLDLAEFDLDIRLGGSGCPRLFLGSCVWDNSEVDVNISGEAIMESAPFTSKASSCSLIVSNVP